MNFFFLCFSSSVFFYPLFERPWVTFYRSGLEIMTDSFKYTTHVSAPHGWSGPNRTESFHPPVQLTYTLSKTIKNLLNNVSRQDCNPILTSCRSRLLKIPRKLQDSDICTCKPDDKHLESKKRPLHQMVLALSRMVAMQNCAQKSPVHPGEYVIRMKQRT